MKCEHCGTSLNGQNWDGTYEEGYCNKLCRKDHEKQLIIEGKIPSIEYENFNVGVMKDSKLRDSRGERIWFPNDERPYFDRALQRTFNTKKEKAEFMKKNKLAMDGSSDLKKKPIEAGDFRFAKVK